MLNVTVDQPTEAGFLTLYPCGSAPPDASNVNFVTGQTVSNAVLALPAPDGRVCVFASAATHVIVDATGFVTP